MDKEILTLLADLHVLNHRQGSGSNADFALELSGIDKNVSLKIVDIGCGTGAASIALAKATNAFIAAVDLLPAFLEKLNPRVVRAGVNERIAAITADMSDLPFQSEQFDVIWSEGAIYNIGFMRGIREWREYLKPNGILVATEITWLTPYIPEELRSHWETEYPEIGLASTKLNQLEDNGYIPIGYFVLQSDCWLDEYYTPLSAGFAEFLERHGDSEQAVAIVEAEKKEIALYKKYRAYYSYGCYIARKAT